ncbi:MAG: DUF2254 domain-containing protein [Clostridiales bacterium]|nr:DUF2254 domain-containing protein [Clostridiales bacterium]
MTDMHSKVHKMKSWFKTNLFWILLSLLMLSILSIFSPFSQANLANYIIPKIAEVSVSAFLTTNATFIATILAIFFSISLFTIQHAANNYTPSLLGDFKTDKKTWFVFFLFSASVVFNLLSLIFNWSLRSVCTSIVLLGFCFIFLGFQFIHTINLIDPLEVIKRIKDKAIKNITRFPKKLQKSIKAVKTRNEFEQSFVKSELYKEVWFHGNESLHEENKKYILQLTDIIQKSTLQREYETCVAGFNAIADIAEEYISIRQNDVTPEDKFLQHIYEKLEAISEIAFRNEDVSLLQEIIKAFEKIGCATTKIEVFSSATGLNQITDLSGYYIHRIGLKSIKEELWDVSAQSVRSLGKVGVSASQKNLWDNVAITSDKICEIGVNSASIKKEWFTVHISNGELARLAIYTIPDTPFYYDAIVPIIENIEKLSVKSIENIKSNTVVTVSPIIGPASDVSAKEMVKAALNVKNKEYPVNETHPSEKYAKDIISKIIDTLRAIGVSAAETQSRTVLDYTNDTLRDIGLICIGEKFVTFKENLEEELINLVNSVRVIYTACEAFSSSSNSKISESLAILGIHCVENKLEKITSNIISDLLNIAIHTMKFDKSEAHIIASKIGLIGVFGTERNNDVIVEKCLATLIKFDKEYVKSCPEHKHQLHLKRLEREYKHFKEMRGNRSDYDGIFSIISDENLQKFKSLYNEMKSNEV